MSAEATNRMSITTTTSTTHATPRPKQITDLPGGVIRKVFEFIQGKLAYQCLRTCKHIRHAILAKPDQCLQGYQLFRGPLGAIQQKSFPKGFQSFYYDPTNGRIAFTCAQNANRLGILDLATGSMVQTRDFPEKSRIRHVDLQRARVLTYSEQRRPQPPINGCVQVWDLPTQGKEANEQYRRNFECIICHRTEADFSQNSLVYECTESTNNGFERVLFLINLNASADEPVRWCTLPARDRVHWSCDIPPKKRLLVRMEEEFFIVERDTGKILLELKKVLSARGMASTVAFTSKGAPVCPVYHPESGMCYVPMGGRGEQIIFRVDVERAEVFEEPSLSLKEDSLVALHLDPSTQQLFITHRASSMSRENSLWMTIQNIASSTLIGSFPIPRRVNSSSRMDYDPKTGDVLIVGESDEIHLWNPKTPDCFIPLSKGNGNISSLSLSPASSKGIKLLWDKKNARLIIHDTATGALTLRGSFNKENNDVKDVKDAKNEKKS